MKVEVSDAARRDLAAAFVYLAERNPRAARATRSAIRNAILGLRQFPNRGRPAESPGTRELIVGKTPYVVVYSVSASVIFIARIRHTKQDPIP